MTAPTGDDALREDEAAVYDRLLEALCLATPPCQDHRDDAAEALLMVLHYGRERAAAVLRAAAEELHVTRFNADLDPDARWPEGAPQVVPDSFYRGINVATLALRYRADALAAQDPT